MIRKALLGDRDMLSELCRSTWAEAYTGIGYYTPEVVASYTDKAFAPAKIADELADPNTQYFIASVQGKPAGYAKLVEKAPPEHINAPCAAYLERIYLKRECHGQGVAQLLMQVVFDEAHARGYQRLWLSVWELNPRAIAFYLKLGFAEAGEGEFAVECDGKRYVDRDMIMVRAISPQFA